MRKQIFDIIYKLNNRCMGVIKVSETSNPNRADISSQRWRFVICARKKNQKSRYK